MLGFLKENLIEKKCSIALEETILGKVDHIVFPYLYKDNYKTCYVFIKSHKKQIFKIMVITLALSMSLSNLALAAPSTKAIDVKAAYLLDIVWKIAKGTIGIMCIWDCAKQIIEGNIQAVPKTVLKYLFAYASMKGLSWGMSFVDGMF